MKAGGSEFQMFDPNSSPSAGRRSRSEPMARICGQIRIGGQHHEDRRHAPAHHGENGPNSQAVTPDSSPPMSFEATMKTLLTAETRPRMGSGVSICTSVWRTTTLTLSTAPAKTSSPTTAKTK